MQFFTRAQADRILQKNFSERYRRLDALERVVDARQYEGRPGFWEPNIPLFEKAPIVKSRIVRDAIADNTSLLLGEGRFPEVTSKQGENSSRDDESGSLDDGLTADQSEVLDDCLEQIKRQVRWHSHERAKYAAAQECGTAVGLLGVRHRKLFADVTRAKWVTAEWRLADTDKGPADGELECLTVQYPYLQSVKDGRETRYRVLLYRRKIDRERDVTFAPVEALEDGSEPDEALWQEDPSKTLAHGFGFVPAVWWRFGRPSGASAETECLDGRAVHEGVEIEPYDMAISQRHRSALYLQPQVVEIGVNAGYNPTEPARSPVYYDAPGSEPSRVTFRQPGETGGRKQGPGFPWQYPEGARVQMLQASAGALQAISEHAADLEAKLAQSLAVVFLDPTRIKYAGSMSGRALKLMKLRQVDRVSEHHDEWADESAQPTLSMLCRIALLKRNELDLPGLKPALPVLARFAKGGVWTFPQLSFIRGPWFDLDAEEEKATVELSDAARKAGLCTRIQAIRKTQAIMGGDDPQDTLDAILEEEEAGRQQAQADSAAQAKLEADAYHLGASKGSAGVTSDDPETSDDEGAS